MGRQFSGRRQNDSLGQQRWVTLCLGRLKRDTPQKLTLAWLARGNLIPKVSFVPATNDDDDEYTYTQKYLSTIKKNKLFSQPALKV